MSDPEVEAPPEPQPQPEAPQPQSVPDDQRVRYEDDPAHYPQVEGFEPAPLSAEEVPLEDSRRDETTVLSTDVFNEEGERVTV